MVNEFALGAFVALAAYKLFQVPLGMILAASSTEHTYTITFGSVLTDLMEAVFLLFLTVLVFTEVIG